MGFLKSGREKEFFRIFQHQAQNNILCAIKLREFFHEKQSSNLCNIKELERAGDQLAKHAYQLLAKTFLTPLEPEDTKALIKALDDVADGIWHAASKKSAYQLDSMRQEALKLVEIILNMTQSVAILLSKQLSKSAATGDVLAAEIEKIKEMEEAADMVLFSALETLATDNAISAKEFVEWKDIIEELEQVTDSCEHTCDVLSAIADKW